MNTSDSSRIMNLLQGFEFPDQLNINSFKKLKKKEKEILKYWFTKVRFTLKPNSGSNWKNQVLVKGMVWDAFESKPKSNIDLIVQSNGSIVDTLKTDENGKYWFLGSRQQNYQIVLGRQQESVYCIDLKPCSSVIVKDFVWLNPYKINTDIMVYGVVRDLNTKEFVNESRVVITGSDGSNDEMKTNSFGVYYFSLDRNTTYQIQAASDKTKKNGFGIELLKYFASEKALVTTINNEHSQNVDLFLESLWYCGIELPVLSFERDTSELDDKTKYHLNGLIEIMEGNPSLVLRLGFRESFHHNQDSIVNIKRFQNVHNYLTGKGINKRRLEYNPNAESLIITKKILEGTGFYPQLNLEQKITKEVYNKFNSYTKSYIDTYIGNSRIEVVRTDFKP